MLHNPGLSRRHLVRAMAVAPLMLSASDLLAAAPFDAAKTVRHLAQVTRAEYHDQKIGTAIADQLLTALREGRLKSSTPYELAEKLNSAINAASHDAHFIVMAGSMADMRDVPPTEPHSPTPPLRESELRFLQRHNFGIAVAEVLEGNIGRLAIRPQFYRPVQQVRTRLADSMRFLSDSRGLIVDLRETIGGDPKAVAYFLSYFFDRPAFIVNRFRWRNLPTEEFSTTSELDGPNYGEKRPVAVLVGSSSYSAAEEFAYDIQVLKRGIVIGQRTPGAANHALPVSLSGGFTAFIPKARAENPVTGTNWEGVGVKPDVEIAEPTIKAARQAVLDRL